MSLALERQITIIIIYILQQYIIKPTVIMRCSILLVGAIAQLALARYAVEVYVLLQDLTWDLANCK